MVTEAEWANCTDPTAMLEFIRGKTSDRKLLMFSVACYRRIWPFVEDEVRQAIEVEELYADGLVSATELLVFNSEINPYGSAMHAAKRCRYLVARRLADHWLSPQTEPQRIIEAKAQSHFLRDIFLFRSASIDPAWLSWHDGLLIAMAQKMYDSRDFSAMPVLADALEEAGCMVPDILNHCRSGGEHVRGCWVVDSLLGKS